MNGSDMTKTFIHPDRRAASRVTSRAVERKLFFFAVGWLTGMVCGEYLCCKISMAAAAAGVILCTAAFLISKFAKEQKHGVAVKKLLIVCVSMLLAEIFFAAYQTEIVAPLERLDGRTVTIRGIVTEIDRFDVGGRITVKGRTLNCAAVTKIPFTVADCTQFDCGDEVSVTCRVKIPDDSPTFGRQDYCRTLGIFLEGDGTTEADLLEPRKSKITYHMNILREKAVGTISQKLPDRSGAFLNAMLCSDKSELTPAAESAIYRAGIGHLFAVSGTHVVILSTFLMTIFDKIMLPIKIRSAATMVFLVCFCVFAGGSVSVVRACIMMALSSAAGFFLRQSDGANSLGFAAILITAACPYAVGSVSFQLSFLASFAMNTVAPAICRGRVTSVLGKNTVALLTVNAVTLPICTLNFSEIPLISAAVNMMIVPICVMALTFCFIFVLLGCKLTIFISAAGGLARGVMAICQVLAKSPLCFVGTYRREIMTAIAVICALIFAAAAIVRRKKAVIFTCVCAYIFAIVGFGICDRLPRRDTVFVLPQKYGAASVIGVGDEVIIFSGGELSNGAYAAARKAEQLHCRKIFVYSLKESPTEYNAIADQLTGITDYCFELLPEGVNGSGGSSRAHFDDGKLVVDCDGGRIIFDNEEISVGGKIYQAADFYGVSTIVI